MSTPTVAMTFNGFEAANTTPVPDVLFDKLLPYLNEAQLKVMLYIIRRTLGFKKTADAISLMQFRYGITKKDGDQLDEGCGLKNFTSITKALRALEEMHCIESIKTQTASKDAATTVYRICFKGTTANVVPTTQSVVGVLQQTYDGTTANVVGVLREKEPQETVIQQTDSQETVIQERESASTHDVSPTVVGLSTDAPSLVSSSSSEQPLIYVHNPGKSVTFDEIVAAQNKVHEEMAQDNAQNPGGVQQPSIPIASTDAQATAEQKQRMTTLMNFIDSLVQEVTGDPTEGFDRSTKTGQDAVYKLLFGRKDGASRVTQERMRKVFTSMWKEPRNPRNGYWLRENMSYNKICEEYEKKIFAILAEENKAKRTNGSTLQLVPAGNVPEEPTITAFVPPSRPHRKRA